LLFFSPSRRQRAVKSSSAVQPLPGKIAARLREAKLVALAAIAAYLFLVLATYDRADPGWSHSAAVERFHNAGGRAGAWLADLLLYLFGVSAWWWMVAFLYGVLWGYRHLEAIAIWDKRPFIIAGAGFVVLLVASSGLEALRFHSLDADLPLGPGGMVGAVIAQTFPATLGFTGATLCLLAAAAIGLSLFSGVSWIALMERIGAGFEWVGFKTIELCRRVVTRKAGEAATGERQVLAKAEKKRVEEHEPIRIEVGPGEIPKSERMMKARQVPLFQELPDTPLPPLAALDEPPISRESVSPETLEFTSRLIEKKLKDFGVEVRVLAAYPGPVITRYEIEPAVGVKGAQVVNLVKDLARALSVISIRVVETIPGKSCMGLEIPNPKRQTVRLAEILGSQVYHELRSPLTLALGKDIGGHPVVADLAKMPHLLVAGTTGSGKSVAINAMILSLLYKSEPREVRMIMVDPKMLELSGYQDIPHLLAPVVTDMKQAAAALMWCIGEMERRYKLMSWLGVRNLSGFNNKVADAEKRGEPIVDPHTLIAEEQRPLTRLPHIVVVIDELADLMMVVGKKIEELIARLAQKARAAGIHLILATQRPSVDVITGLIKANVPTRIAFQVSSRVDSRTILDQQGAEALLGQGDMLYLPPGSGQPQRVHGAFVADHEVHKVVEYLKSQGKPEYVEGVLDTGEGNGEGDLLIGEGGGEQDPLYDEAVEVVLRTRRPSISLVQRHLRVGYNRAARLIEDMERAGLVSAMQTNGNRDVLVPAKGEG
jgi:S-DNA-T family DNA segregation ATPase FtsK/SpoIIIE